MEFFNKAKFVRLRSHLDKYLVADSDEQSVLQTSIGGSPDTRWTVEFVEGKSHVIRLKSCHGKYLTAGDEPFLLGMTGKKVVQSCPTNKSMDNSVEWEPIKDGHLVKLRTRGEKFLRANGGTLPWRNSITHDIPHSTATQDWVLWDVEMLGVCSPDEGELVPSCESPLPSYEYPISRVSPFRDDFTGSGKHSPSTKSDGSSRQLDGMLYFVKAKYVRLQSHNGKYLIADTDEKTVRQSQNGSSEWACWKVELVTGKGHAIRLKSCHDLYLTASYDPFLLGMTGKKVHQSLPATKKDPSIEWEPIIEVDSRDSHVKLKSVDGKFLRANGGTPPWRNSITHDVPLANATQGWIWWGVEALDNASLSKLDSRPSCLSPMSSFSSSFSNDFIGSPAPDTGSPMGASAESPHASRIQDGMTYFNKAKIVRLQSHHYKYLIAEDDQNTVRQSRNGSSHKARWTVEFVDGKTNILRLKSCHGLYLTATNVAFLLGMTGKKVIQSLLASQMDPSIEWEPIKQVGPRGLCVKLRSSNGKYLRANGGTPPWNNSITHDVPYRTKTQDWILWGVDVLDISLPIPSSKSSFSSSMEDDFMGSPDKGSTLGVSRTSGLSNIIQDGMMYFVKAKYVRLQSHNGKYLVADIDQKTVRQSHNDSSERACWRVELVTEKGHAIRLKSCHDLYLTASYDPFVLGMTGKKVHQSLPATKKDPSIEWEPIIEVDSRESHVKLKSVDGKFLRANGGTPPWRNSITHDVPRENATQGWIWWGVEALDNASLSKLDSRPGCLSPMSSFSSSFSNDFIASPAPDTGSPMGASAESPHAFRIQDGMEYFNKAKVVRLQSHQDKYLVADDDENTVRQSRNGSSYKARWTVEFVDGKTNVLLLKSCHGLYLTATNVAFLLGMTGKKVIQSLPASKMDPSIEWEPIKEVGPRGLCVKLRSSNGKYLRANGGTPPWNNSITHDVPQVATTQDWILWGVDVLDVSLPKFELVSCPSSKSSFSSSMVDDFMGSPDKGSPLDVSRTSGLSDITQPSDSFDGLEVKADGRVIHYNIADDKGNFDDGIQGSSFHFKGHTLEELTQKLEQETGLEGISVCFYNPLNDKLYPLRLALPPNNATMHIVVVPSTTYV